MITLQQMAVLMARIEAAFPNSKPDKMTTQLYYEFLKDYDGNEIRIAIDTCIEEPGRVFPPTVGEIKKAWMWYRDTKPNNQKMLEGSQPVYVPMPQYCIDELDAFFKAKGHRSKYREFYQHVSEESRK